GLKVRHCARHDSRTLSAYTQRSPHKSPKRCRTSSRLFSFSYALFDKREKRASFFHTLANTLSGRDRHKRLFFRSLRTLAEKHPGGVPRVTKNCHSTAS